MTNKPTVVFDKPRPIRSDRTMRDCPRRPASDPSHLSGVNGFAPLCHYQLASPLALGVVLETVSTTLRDSQRSFDERQERAMSRFDSRRIFESVFRSLEVNSAVWIRLGTGVGILRISYSEMRQMLPASHASRSVVSNQTDVGHSSTRAVRSTILASTVPAYTCQNAGHQSPMKERLIFYGRSLIPGLER